MTAVTEAYADALADGQASSYRILAATAAGGSVPGDLIPLLERVCALSLETGKARDLGRAEGERVLMAVFSRTPRGRSMLHAIEAVNRALGTLAGRRLRSVQASMPLPGRYVLSVQTDDVGLRVQVGTGGVTIESLTAG